MLRSIFLLWQSPCICLSFCFYLVCDPPELQNLQDGKFSKIIMIMVIVIIILLRIFPTNIK